MIKFVLSKSVEGFWRKSQLSTKLQGIGDKYPAQFDGTFPLSNIDVVENETESISVLKY